MTDEHKSEYDSMPPESRAALLRDLREIYLRLGALEARMHRQERDAETLRLKDAEHEEALITGEHRIITIQTQLADLTPSAKRQLALGGAGLVTLASTLIEILRYILGG